MSTIPQPLLRRFKDRRVALFVGAGVSMAAGLPSWNSLVSGFAEALNIKPDSPTGFSRMQLLTIPQYYENNNSRRELLKLLKENIPSSPSQKLHIFHRQ